VRGYVGGAAGSPRKSCSIVEAVKFGYGLAQRAAFTTSEAPSESLRQDRKRRSDDDAGACANIFEELVGGGQSKG
jgi:hypothetical protein